MIELITAIIVLAPFWVPAAWLIVFVYLFNA